MKVVIAMSGGVDSSVAALLLRNQGHECIGLFMKNWEDEQCTATQDFDDVASVCAKIGIPCYAVNFAKEYKEKVFADFVEQYKLGLTPNPDILCNREIKFKVLMEKAFEMGADFLATGHYAQNVDSTLVRAVDANKDQTYFLYTLKNEILQKVLFPIGHLPKPQVRQIAQEAGLPTASKKDSTGICFIGERKFREFLSNYVISSPGPIETIDGKVIGTHSGLSFHTIGQRKGLCIGGQKEGNGEAWFVVRKERERNALIVAQGDHESLYSSELNAFDVSWVNPVTLPLRATAKIRYRQADQPCMVYPTEVGVRAVFDEPQKAITARQSVVFYDGPTCLGGGVIS